MFYCLAGFLSISDKEKIDNDVIAIRFPIRYTQQPCNFPVGLPKKPKKSQTPGGSFLALFLFMEVFFSGGKPTGKLLLLTYQ
jgi:hypothetical protein